MSNSLKTFFNFQFCTPSSTFLKIPIKDTFHKPWIFHIDKSFHKRATQRILLNPGLIQPILPIISAVSTNLCTPRKYITALFCTISISVDLIYPHTPLLYWYTAFTPASFIFFNVNQHFQHSKCRYHCSKALSAASARDLVHELSFKCSSSITPRYLWLLTISNFS